MGTGAMGVEVWEGYVEDVFLSFPVRFESWF